MRSIPLIPFSIALLLSGCISYPKQAFDKSAQSEIRSIALLDVPPPRQFEVVNLGGVSAGFGLMGAAVESSERARKTTDFTAAAERQRADLGLEMMRVLWRGLKKQGYRVTVLGDVRPVKQDDDDQDADYSHIRTDADAILDVYFTRASYVAPGSNYLPWLMVGARLIASKNRNRLFAQEYSYGNAFEATENVTHFPSDPKYSYGDAEVLTEHAAEAADALRAGAVLIGGQIVSALR